METDILIYSDKIKQECCSDDNDSPLEDKQQLQCKGKDAASTLTLKEVEGTSLIVKEEMDDTCSSLDIKEEEYSDEDLDQATCFNNFMNTNLTLEDKIKEISDKSSKHLRAPNKKSSYKVTKPFKCTICEKIFTQKGHLTQHLLIHDGIKSFKCAICEKAFSQKSALTRHSAIHNGTKTFKCSFCKKAFNRKGNLIQHLLIHDAIKPFKCTICDKAFTHKTALTYHLAVHNGTKPFKCTICLKAFIEKFRLKKHLASHDGFKCTICDKPFKRKSSLQRHLVIHEIK